MKRLRDEEVSNASKYAISKFAKDMVIIIDTLEYALKSVKDCQLESLSAEDPLRVLFDGLQLTHEKLLKTLNTHGVIRLDPSGEKFDSSQHMAILQISDPTKEPGTIIETRKVGYILNGRIIRAAEVVVASEKR